MLILSSRVYDFSELNNIYSHTHTHTEIKSISGIMLSSMTSPTRAFRSRFSDVMQNDMMYLLYAALPGIKWTHSDRLDKFCFKVY